MANPLDPWYVTGLIDGEGCFFLAVRPQQRQHTASLCVGLRVDDAEILYRLQEFFQCGKISIQKNADNAPAVRWVVTRIPDLVKVISHFERFPLQSKKLGDYKVWKEFVLLKQQHYGKQTPVDFYAPFVNRLKRYRIYDGPSLEELRKSGNQQGGEVDLFR